jgi:SIR2-like domain
LKNHSEKITIFTTNYDKAIELYCSRAGYQLIDGFWRNGDEHVWRDDHFYYPTLASPAEGQNYVYLYKLHGSLNWKRHVTGTIIRTTEEGRSSDPNIKENLLIYPTLSPKSDSGEPFNTVFKEFEAKMNDIDVCIIIGFSFRDNDISNMFKNFAGRNGSVKRRRRIIVISPSAGQDFFRYVVRKEKSPEANNPVYDTLYDKAGLTIINKGIGTASIEEIMNDITESLNQ